MTTDESKPFPDDLVSILLPIIVRVTEISKPGNDLEVAYRLQPIGFDDTHVAIVDADDLIGAMFDNAIQVVMSERTFKHPVSTYVLGKVSEVMSNPMVTLTEPGYGEHLYRFLSVRVYVKKLEGSGIYDKYAHLNHWIAIGEMNYQTAEDCYMDDVDYRVSTVITQDN